MKLSEILGRILTDVALRQQYKKAGVCELVDRLAEREAGSYDDICLISKQFRDARQACTQTYTWVYPVDPTDPAVGEDMAGRGALKAFDTASEQGTMWRGQYGINRRKLVRDCWRWAKERGL